MESFSNEASFNAYNNNNTTTSGGGGDAGPLGGEHSPQHYNTRGGGKDGLNLLIALG